ncbi:MAG: malate/lactate/ureidoglycolate dehydrogenase [Alphaproteobacteria bacterium]
MERSGLGKAGEQAGAIVLVDAVDFASLGADILTAAGCSQNEARRIADRLVLADMTGHQSHGIGRIPRYVKMMADGDVWPGRSVTVESESDAFMLLDGNAGFGQTVGERAVELGCARAHRAGVAVVGLKNSGHLGRISDWAELAADEGFVSIHFVNVRGRSLVAPFGGIDRRMATSPFAVGVPMSGEAPIILDFATSLVAEGKAFAAAKGGSPLPEGALISATGEASRDPADLYGDTVGDFVPDASRGPGALAAFGGHKGSGLNFMIELLAGALTGSGVNRTFNDRDEKPLRNGMLSIYIDPERFAGRSAFEAQARDYVAYVKSARVTGDHTEVLIPGEKERRLMADRKAGGVPFSSVAWRDLTELAKSCGVAESIPALLKS